MHNIWVRLNAVIFFGLTVLLVLATLSAFSTYLHKGQPEVRTLRLNTLKSLRNHGGVDRALLSFDLNADLSPAFHKQIHSIRSSFGTKSSNLQKKLCCDSKMNLSNMH